MGVDHALGVAGGAGGEEHRGDVVGAGLRDLALVEAGVSGVVGTSRIDQRVEGMKPVFLIVAQPARVVEPDAHEGGAVAADLEHLVHLLLILDDRKGDLGVEDRKGVFGGARVLVERDRHRAERLGREHRGIETGPVLADDDDVLAALQAGFRQAAGECPDERGERAPALGLPDAELLLAQRRRIRTLRGMVEHQLWEGGSHPVTVGRF